MEWEKVFANDATDKGLIPKHTNCAYNSIKKNQKMSRRLNRHLSTEDIQMAKRHMKRCSTLQLIREMQVKTTMRYYLTPVRMTIIKIINAEDGVEKRKSSYTVGAKVS